MTTPFDQPHLSISQLEMLSKCGEQYRRRYIEREIVPPGIALIVGTATDRTVTRNLQHKIDHKQLLTLEEVADTARDGLNQAWEGGVKLEPEEAIAGVKKVKGEAVDKAVRLSVLHAREKAPRLEPTHVQRKWAVELKGYPVDLVGVIDVQEGSSAVRDTKTSGKTPAENIAEQSDQLTAYALALRVIDGKPPAKVALDYLIDNKTPVLRTFESKRDNDDFAALLRRVEVAIMALDKGVFMPARQTDWWCSPRWCGYHATCRFVRQPKPFAA